MTAQPDSRPFRWCFSTMGCPDFSLEQTCLLAKEFDIHELEVRSLGGRVDLPRWAAEKNYTPAAARALLERHAVQFRVAGSSFKLAGHDEKARAELLEFSRWADAWGATYVRVFGGGTWGQPLTEADFAQAAQAVNWWQQEKGKNHWQLEMLLETHDAFSASPPCRELLARLDRPIGLIWDSHHTWKLGQETPGESWAQLSKWVRHVQIKDSISKPSARHPYSYVLPGEGETPLGDIIGVLRDHHFSGAVSLEWELLWHPYLPPLRDALARMQSQPWFARPAGRPALTTAPG